MRQPSIEPLEPPSPESSYDRMVQALLAREGFARVAAIATELVGARVEVLVPRPGSEGDGGTANERFVAELVGGGLPPWPPAVTEVVPIVVDDQIQGAVIANGELAGGTEAHLQSAARAALTGIAILDTREEVRRDSASGLIADLLSGRRLGSSDVAERAGKLGCDLSGGFLALAVRGQEARGPGEIVAAIKLAHAGAITEPVDGIVVALIPGRGIDTVHLDANLGSDVPRSHSSTYDDPGHALRALDEARTLLALIRDGAVPNTDRQTWDSLRILHGAYVNEPARLIDFCERTIGDLIRRDENEERRLQDTFWAYQEANCNMNVTAGQLDAHRHTVANRLRRIRQLTGLDPQRGYDRELLGLAFRTYLVIENSRWR
ncbi:MAG TPA: helix-turn-helix domain-containing protein [Solirubrobacterales bacterium]|nr:helix-turn-helix domain-containing protein [Solirubrobacterales bacterium]